MFSTYELAYGSLDCHRILRHMQISRSKTSLTFCPPDRPLIFPYVPNSWGKPKSSKCFWISVVVTGRRSRPASLAAIFSKRVHKRYISEARFILNENWYETYHQSGEEAFQIPFLVALLYWNTCCPFRGHCVSLLRIREYQHVNVLTIFPLDQMHRSSLVPTEKTCVEHNSWRIGTTNTSLINLLRQKF